MSSGLILVLAAGIAVLAGAGMGIAIYNGLITVKNNVGKSFKNIDLILQQRNDELTKLIETAKGYMKYEKDLLGKIIELRTGYAAAKDMSDKVKIENELSKLVGKLNMVWEQYPDLKAIQSVMQLQGRVSAVESKIADYRETFNDAVNIYNIQIERFPDLLLARIMNYQRHAFLEIPEEKKKDVKMSFA